MTSQPMEPEMAQFFDFSDAGMPDVSQAIAGYTSAPSPQLLDATGADGLAAPVTDPTWTDALPIGADEPIGTEAAAAAAGGPILRQPKFSTPAVPCEYCRAMKLACFFTYDDQESCGACNALFRPCNLKYDRVRPTGVMDTLHPVLEDQCIEQGGQTGIITLKSMSYAGGPRVLDEDSRIPGRKTGIRFSRANIKILKDWILKHRDNPYPTEEEKEKLCLETSLTPVQISNWFANTRRRVKQSTRSRSPTMPTPIGSGAVDIRPNKQGLTHRSKEWETLTPMDRWKISPPENEPAKVEDIANAVATTRLSPPDATGLQQVRQPRSRGGLDSSANSDSLSVWQARSTANSQDTGRSLVSSGSFSNTSLGSGLSHGSSRNSFGSFGGKVQKDRRRRRRTAANPSKSVALDDSRRIFQCTFCTDTFKSKYDWTRHEKSLHLSLEKWICTPLGEVITDPTSGVKKCVYCDLQNPDANHLETHNFRACEEKGLQGRTFYRKDHLRQHLRLMHGCKMSPAMEAWKSEATYIKCRCGFCGADFSRWSDRVDHIAKHFRNGSTMKDWKGCRGLEPSVAAHVTNAMPPYLIANEAKSPFPFSASNESSIRHHHQAAALHRDLEAIGINQEGYEFDEVPQRPQLRFGSTPSMTISDPLPTPGSGSSGAVSPLYPANAIGRIQDGRTTCWEILTVRLGRFVADHYRNRPEEPLTDEVLQRQARRILYDDDDAWNQTAADNPEWLSLFRQAHSVLSKGQPLQPSFDYGEDLGIGELTFDQFFEQEEAASGGLTFAGGAGDIPAAMNPNLACNLYGHTRPMPFSQGPNDNVMEAAVAAGSDLGMAQYDPNFVFDDGTLAMNPAVDLMALNKSLAASGAAGGDSMELQLSRLMGH